VTTDVFDVRACVLGEGPLWHPERQQLFWFDILGKTLLSQRDGKPLTWAFDESVSAAGWIDFNTLLIASETGLWKFNLMTGERSLIVPLEEDQP
jgi:sugar lactone lactonase YvrE